MSNYIIFFRLNVFRRYRLKLYEDFRWSYKIFNYFKGLNWWFKRPEVRSLTSLRFFVRKRRFNIFKSLKYSPLKFFTIKKTFLLHLSKVRLTQFSFSLLQRVYTSPRLVTFLSRNYFVKNRHYKFQFGKPLLKQKVLFHHHQDFVQARMFFPYMQRLNQHKPSVFYFFDAHSSPLRALFLARQVHSKFGRKKTLRNVAYKVFLKRELSLFPRLDSSNFSLLYIIRSFDFVFNWIHAFLILKLGLVFINGVSINKNITLQPCDIFQVPCFTGLLYLSNFYYLKLLKIKKKIKRAKYVFRIVSKKIWMSRKRNKNQFFNWIKNFHLMASTYFLFDKYTNCGIIFPKQLTGTTDTINLTTRYSSVMKLYSWKFRST